MGQKWMRRRINLKESTTRLIALNYFYYFLLIFSYRALRAIYPHNRNVFDYVYITAADSVKTIREQRYPTVVTTLKKKTVLALIARSPPSGDKKCGTSNCIENNKIRITNLFYDAFLSISIH